MVKAIKKNKKKESLKKIIDDYKKDLLKIKDEQKIVLIKSQINNNSNNL